MKSSTISLQRLAFLLIAFLTGLCCVAHADIVVNGSFEADDIPRAGYNDPGFITGWVVNEDPNNQVTLFDRPDLVAPDGEQFVVFNGGGTAPTASIAQALTTVAGGTYEVSFWAGANIPSRSGVLALAFDGTGTSGLAIASEEGNIGTLTSFENTSFSFQAMSASTTFVFEDNSTSTIGSDLFVDHLVINFVGVPEPSALGIFVTAGMLAAARGRRRGQVS